MSRGLERDGGGQEQPLEECPIRVIFRHQEGASRRIFHDRSVIEEWEGVCCAQRAWKKSRRGGLALLCRVSEKSSKKPERFGSSRFMY